MTGQTRSPIWFLRNKDEHTQADLGNHTFCAYSSQEELREILGAFSAEGNAQGETTLHFAVEPLEDSGMWRVKDAWGAARGVPIGSLETGTDDHGSVGGLFSDPESLLHDLLGGSAESGRSRVRLALEVWPPAGLEIPPSRMLEFEETLSRVLVETQAAALCLYDQRGFHPDLLLDVAHAHPSLRIRGRVLENGHLTWSRKVGERAEKGGLEGYIGGVMEWNRAREDARLARELPQTLIDAVNEPIMIIAPTYEVGLMNRAARARYGREPGITRVHCYEVSHDRERPCEGTGHSCPLQEVLATKRAATVVHEHTATDGEARIVEIVASPLLGEDGEIAAIVESMWDVTARVRAEEGLRESEARFRSVAQTAADAVIITNADRHILFWNSGAERMFGYEEQEVLGRDWMTLMADEVRPSARRALANSARVPESGSRGGELSTRADELIGRRKSGSDFPASLSASWWRSRGMVFHGLIIRDLTEMRATQERAMAQERLAAVGQLAAGLAHDFNNILMPVVMYSELLLKDPQLSSDKRDMLGTIHAEAIRAGSLTDQILDFSRQSVMNMRSIDLAWSLRELVGLLRRTLAANIAVRLVGDAEGTFVRADQGRIHQLFLNLALNARDAMPNGGELEFRLASLEVPTREPPYRDMAPGLWVQVVVSDTGKGISPEDVPHVFEPFFTTKAPGKGTGLGLSQAYGIVKQHGGYIDVQSENGRGTDVVVYFPRATSDSSEIVSPPATKEKDGIGSLLVVEDNESTLAAVCKILREMKYTVQAASGGDEALRALQDAPVDLVVCDYVMTGLSGMELMRKFRQARPGVRILVMSGYPLGSGTRELLEGGRVEWLQKPFGSETLSAKVREMLSAARAG